MPDLLDELQSKQNAGGDLLDELNSKQTSQPAQPSFMSRLTSAPNDLNTLRDILTGAAQFSQGVESAPYNIAKSLGAPQSVLQSRLMPQPTNIDFGSYFGVPQPSMFDKLVQSATQYAPAAITGGATLLGQMMAGAGYGLTQSGQSPFLGAAAGAAGAALPAVIIKGSMQAPTLAQSLLTRYAGQGLEKGIVSQLDQVKNLQNMDAFNKISNNYATHEAAEKAAWDKLENIATDTDNAAEQQGIDYDNSGYVKSLQDLRDKLDAQAKGQSGFARANAASINLLDNYINDNHETFSDAIAHNKALNQDYKNEITPGVNLPFSTINYAKANIKENIAKNINDNGLQDTLGSAWNEANNITAQKNSIYNETTTASGTTQPSLFMKYYRGDKGYSDPSNFIKEYLPTGIGEGTQKMQQLGAMMGDEDAAKNIIKSNLFDNAYTTTGINGEKVLNQYNKLSPEQRNYLFTPDQQQQIQAYAIWKDRYPNDQSSIFGFGAWHNSLAAALGLGVGALVHHPYIGALTGATAANLAGKGLSAMMERPVLQQSAIDYLTKAKLGSLKTSLGDVLSQAAAAVSAPQAVKEAAGD